MHEGGLSLYPTLLFDVNVLIYLYNLGVHKIVLGSVTQSYTGDMLQYQEMQSVPWGVFANCGMKALGVTGEQMKEVYGLTREHTSLSLYDAEMLVLAKYMGYPLTTEDRKMIRIMGEMGLCHISLPDLIDQLAMQGVISPSFALVLFRKISVEFLPKRYDNCAGYITKYERMMGEGGRVEVGEQ